VFGTPDQSRVLDEKREMVLAAAQRHGKACSMLVSSPAEARKWRDAGELLVYSSDVEMLHSGFGQFVASIRPEIDAKSRSIVPSSRLTGKCQP
jgi:2-keto-3-deoxy-L-rhamnonate aldolase RhmA